MSCEIQMRPRHMLCGIISHGVLSLALMFWFGHLHHTTDCDAFVASSARVAPLSSSILIDYPLFLLNRCWDS